jgi:DNA-binding MarR family transcriptional regulator
MKKKASSKKSGVKKSSSKKLPVPHPLSHPFSHPFSVERAEDSSGFLLWQMTMLWQRRINAALKEFDLTHGQFVVLASAAWLARQSDAVTQQAIAAHANIDKMMTSNIVRSLQEKGLITRAEHSTDTRAKTVTLTPDGERALMPALHTVERIDKEVFAPLGTTVATFNQLLQKMLDASRSSHSADSTGSTNL